MFTSYVTAHSLPRGMLFRGMLASLPLYNIITVYTLMRKGTSIIFRIHLFVSGSNGYITELEIEHLEKLGEMVIRFLRIFLILKEERRKVPFYRYKENFPRINTNAES